MGIESSPATAPSKPSLESDQPPELTSRQANGAQDAQLALAFQLEREQALRMPMNATTVARSCSAPVMAKVRSKTIQDFLSAAPG